MNEPKPSVSSQEFATLVQRAGLRLDDGQRAELYGVYGQFEAMLARMRNGRDRSAEPAHVFVPGQAWPT